MRVIATAGHVDHGKSTLLRALTGEDPDRWAEEKARGLTIDLGFVATTLASGVEVGFVDVPGHARFVKNMLAGVSAVDACLFVVAATEGWMPQTEEHLRILELLGIHRGVVAVTKVAFVDDEWRQLVLLDLAEHLAGTFLDGADVVEVDAPAGVGVDALRRSLDRLVAATPPAADVERPRLWVDRSFPIHGAGTVVTGTLSGGRLALDDLLVVAPGQRRVRVRGMESHHRPLTRADPGRRLAVNLVGVAHHDIQRGHALVLPGQWHETAIVDVELRVLGSLSHPVTRRGAYRAYIGSADLPVRLRLLGQSGAVEPGGTAVARLWLTGDARLPLLPGDRYVLREDGRSETVGGGRILDVAPILRPSRAAPSLDVDRVIAERGWVDAGELTRLTGVRRAPTLDHWVVAPAALAGTEAAIRDACRAAGPEGLRLAAFDEQARAVLARGLAGVALDADRVVAEEWIAAPLDDEATDLLARLEAAGNSPPDLAVEHRRSLRELERRGLVVQAEQLWFAASAVAEATRVLAELAAAHPEGFTVAAARDAWGSTRKHAMPLLAYLDRQGVTRRRGDLRVPGPRMPPAQAPTPPAQAPTPPAQDPTPPAQALTPPAQARTPT